MWISLYDRWMSSRCSFAEFMYELGDASCVFGLQDKPRDSTVDAAVLARQTPGFSGAELSNLVNEAALLAAKTSKPKISAELLDSARDKAIMGVERR